MPEKINDEFIRKLFRRCNITPGSRLRYDSSIPMQIRSGTDENGESDGTKIISGKAIAYESETVLFRFKDPWDGKNYEFREIISKGAVDENTEKRNCVLDLNHDCVNGMGGIPIARSGGPKPTLVLSEKSDKFGDGYGFDATIYEKNERNNQIAVSIDEGLLYQCSFAFHAEDEDIVREETTEKRGDDEVHVVKTRINHISELADVSIVTNAAYSETSVTMSQRSAMDLEKFLSDKREAGEREAQLEAYREATKRRFDNLSKKGN